ncbi:MAG: tail fiber protein [Acidobacteria bacterium]|nr:tail fiber protein [Acidobacteriota bacterium]
MPEPYVGEIRMFGGNFAPVGWEFCQGQLLPISENETLFQLIGTTYGGDGQSTFALPNLASRVPIHMGTGRDGTTFTIGEQGGTESVTLTTQQIPVHNHALLASLDNASASAVLNNVTGQVGATQIYREAPPAALMAPQALGASGGSQPHENTQPFLCINFIISLFGVFPSQT